MEQAQNSPTNELKRRRRRHAVVSVCLVVGIALIVIMAAAPKFVPDLISSRLMERSASGGGFSNPERTIVWNIGFMMTTTDTGRYSIPRFKLLSHTTMRSLKTMINGYQPENFPEYGSLLCLGNADEPAYTFTLMRGGGTFTVSSAQVRCNRTDPLIDGLVGFPGKGLYKTI